ncbi:PREDICTED: 3-phosphoinositide-dependent protein kinase 1 [Nicrophorus vespilloides]|uniref:3-phosphoinositide-dependent protein kinase 1 n=1 Tax=Nicrophorus vespilloides TaxID=110193 RepID=A0ABM1MWT9_NICVS|nr:PREDICTED: 3-phosphoinositide-dependent protein kinase 1 [Nicrophorus vespilloides]XP_017779039.1 PREDICTED: 3-phosphoinositide-dependent protein kinase 1 [Nicrophorus vespilloides]
MTPVPVPADEPPKKRSAADFIFGKVIGEGSFSTVYLAKDIHTNKEFAIKVLEKLHIKKERKLAYVTREKEVLLRLASWNELFVKLYCTFQDVDRLYFVLTYAKNGDLLTHIKHLSLECVRFYAAEIIMALERLNIKKIIHRDLKPENILLDENWHVLLTDFGSAKIVKDEIEQEECGENSKRRNSFVGTAQYVTPEVLTDGNVSFASDLWALGCVIYQMVCGTAPFQAGSEYLIFKKILDLEYSFPEDFDSRARNLVEQLLVINPHERLGSCDVKPYTSIREHQFFSKINWHNLGKPPKICSNREVEIEISDELEPGFDEQKASRLQLELICPTTPTRKRSEVRNIADISDEEVVRRLETQKQEKWHQLVEGNLILKQGLVDKRKGLFPRRRMLLLTQGPHLYYVDPATMILKGEIPWSEDLRPEAKNFKIFHVHTPNRVYYLEDPEGYALEWCKAIEDVKSFYYTSKSS